MLPDTPALFERRSVRRPPMPLIPPDVRDSCLRWPGRWFVVAKGTVAALERRRSRARDRGELAGWEVKVRFDPNVAPGWFKHEKARPGYMIARFTQQTP